MPEQLAFVLPFRVAMGRQDFFLSDSNESAVAGIDAWRAWPNAKMLLIGPEGAGKTHLAQVWATQSGAEIWSADAVAEADLLRLSDLPALVLEDVDRVAGMRAVEECVFHLHNALAARAAPLLLTARRPAARWPMVLPDLASRMAQAGQLTLSAPDDALLSVVMVKLAEDRQLALTPGMVRYAVPRIERSFAAVGRLIEELDAMTLAAKEPPRQKHIRAILSR